MTWGIEKAQERFKLEHAPLGQPQGKLQRFLEVQLGTPGKIRCYGTKTNLSQQLKNKLGQANTIPGGMLTLSLESKNAHDRAVETLVEEWGQNDGWSKAVACVGLVYATDNGWKLVTIIEWTRSDFPARVRKHLNPDVVVHRANGSPSSGADGAAVARPTADTATSRAPTSVSPAEFSACVRELRDYLRGSIIIGDQHDRWVGDFLHALATSGFVILRGAPEADVARLVSELGHWFGTDRTLYVTVSDWSDARAERSIDLIQSFLDVESSVPKLVLLVDGTAEAVERCAADILEPLPRPLDGAPASALVVATIAGEIPRPLLFSRHARHVVVPATRDSDGLERPKTTKHAATFAAAAAALRASFEPSTGPSRSRD